MIRNVSDGDAEAGAAGNPQRGEAAPDPSREETPGDHSDSARGVDEEAEVFPPASPEAIGDPRRASVGPRGAQQDRPEADSEVGRAEEDGSGSEDDEDDEDDEEAPDDVMEPDTIGLEAVGLDSVERRRPRSGATSPTESTASTAFSSGQERASSGQEPAPPGDPAELKGAVESILFSLSEPIGIRALGDLLGVGVHEVRGVVEELRYEYVESQRAFRLEEIAGGVQLLTQSRYDPWVGRLRQREKEGRLSAAALETLAVVAYKQPITKADLEGIRGVGCSPILKTLMDRGLLQVVGRDEGLGRPLLYGTTKRFLESFGLQSVRDLPQPEEVATEENGGRAARDAPD